MNRSDATDSVVWNRRLDPTEARHSPRQVVPPVTWTDLGNRFHACALRRLHLDEEGRCDRYRDELELYVERHELGEVLWPERDFCFAPNFRDVVDTVAARGLWIFDIWGYRPEGDYDRADDHLAPIEAGPVADVHGYLQQRLGPKFLGWDNGEQDGRYIGSYALRNCPGSRTRREAWKRFARYMQRLASEHNHCLTALLGLYHAHHLAHMGSHRLLGAETGQMLPSVPPWYACIRGAGKQYGILWFGNASVYNRWGYKSYERDDGYAGPERGTSLSLLERLWYVEFMYGACLMGYEHGHLLEGELTPIGRLQQAAYRWCRQHEDLGVQYTPAAFLVDFYAGWQPPRTAYGLSWPYRVWGELDYSPGDHQIDQVFRVVWPGYQDASYYRDERGFLTPTPVGDMFDVLTANAGEEVLGQYRCLMVLGDLTVEGRVWRKLEQFAAAGGEVIAAVNQLGPEALTGLGLRLGACETDSVSVTPDGTRLDEPRFSYQRVDGNDAVPLLSASNGDPLVLHISCGAGGFTVLAIPFGLVEPDTDVQFDFDPTLPVRCHPGYQGPVWGEDQPIPSPYALVAGVRQVLLERFAGLELVKIDSAAPIQSIVNVGAATDELVLTLVNNGAEPWRGSFDLTQAPLAGVEDLFTGHSVNPGTPVSIPAGKVGIYRLRAGVSFMRFAEPAPPTAKAVRLTAWSRVDPDRGLEENIDILRRTDVRGVEIWGPQVIDLPEEELRLVAEQIAAAELEVVALNLAPCQGPFLGSPFGYNIPEWRRRAAALADRAVRAVEILHAHRLIVTLGGCEGGEATGDRAAADIADFARRVRLRGTKVLVELSPCCYVERTSPWMPAPVPDRLASLVDTIGQDNVRAAVNLGHLRCLGQDPVTVAGTLGARLSYVQLNAFGSSFGGAPLDAHRPYSEDAAAANALLEFLDASGYTGVVCLDSSWDQEPLAGLRALLADARRRPFLAD